MFLGEFQYKVDEKGRIPIPPRFRREIKDGVILLPGIEKCITAYTIPEWKKVAGNLTSGSIAQSKLRRLNRAFFATAFNLLLDGQGRVALPAPLREYAGINDEAIVTGVNNCFELWNTEQWGREKAASLEEAWQTVESIEKR